MKVEASTNFAGIYKFVREKILELYDPSTNFAPLYKFIPREDRENVKKIVSGCADMNCLVKKNKKVLDYIRDRREYIKCIFNILY